MQAIHCKVRIDRNVRAVNVPRVAPVVCRFGDEERELPEAELEYDESEIWATFWVPDELEIEDSNQVEVTAELVPQGSPDGDGAWSIASLNVYKIW